MAMHNPYAAYQRYATNVKPQVAPKEAQVPSVSHESEQHKVVPAGTVPLQSNKGANHYLENSVLTATPEELTLMLYDGAIKFMNQAVVYIDTKNIEKTSNALIRAQDIFSELMSTLNMDIDISKHLNSLYDYIKTSLQQANIKKDPQLIRDMIGFTKELRDTWAEAMKIAKKG